MFDETSDNNGFFSREVHNSVDGCGTHIYVNPEGREERINYTGKAVAGFPGYYSANGVLNRPKDAETYVYVGKVGAKDFRLVERPDIGLERRRLVGENLATAGL